MMPFLLWNSPGWLQFIGDRNVKTKQAAINYITNAFIGGYKKNGFGFWMVELIGNNEPIGMCGITKRDGLEGVDIGYALLPAYAANGYAYEMAYATLHYGLTQIKLPFILAITNNNNVRSIHLLEKMGLTFQHTTKLTPEGEELNVYKINKPIIPN